MKVDANTSDDGLGSPDPRLSIPALGQAIAEQVKIAINAPVTQMTMQTAINRGLAAAVNEVEKRLGEAAIRASEGALGRFLASTFARLRKALDSEDA